MLFYYDILCVGLYNNYFVIHFSILFTVISRIILQYPVIYSNVMCSTVFYYNVSYLNVLCFIGLCNTVLFCVVLPSTVLWYTSLQSAELYCSDENWSWTLLFTYDSFNNTYYICQHIEQLEVWGAPCLFF